MKVTKVLVLAMIVFVSVFLAEKSYAMKPLASFLLDKNFYSENYFTILPNDPLENHPAWLVDMPNQWTSSFSYDGIVNLMNGDWKGTRSYNYDYSQYLIVHLPGDEIFSSQVLSYNLEGNYFYLGMEDPKSQVDVHDYENYIAPSVTYSATFKSLKALSFGVGLAYFISNYGQSTSNPFVDYEVRLNPEEDLYFGLRHRVQDFSLSLDENLGFQNVGAFSLNWTASNPQEINELYAYKSFLIGSKNNLLIKVDYTPLLLQDNFNEAEMSLSYIYDKRAGISFFGEESEQKEKGTIRLKSMPPIPPLYEAIGKEYGVDISSLNPNLAEMEIDYSILRFGAKVFGFIDSRNKNRLDLIFSRGIFNADLKGTTSINISADKLINIGLTPFMASGNLEIQEDQIGGAYSYNAENWNLGFGLRYIALYDLSGSVSYSGIASDTSKVEFDDLKLWRMDITSSVKIADSVKLNLSLAQYFPAFDLWESGNGHKNPAPPAPANPPPSSPPTSGDPPPPAPSHSGSSSVPLSKYLTNSGFSVAIGLTYYF